MQGTEYREKKSVKWKNWKMQENSLTLRRLHGIMQVVTILHCIFYKKRTVAGGRS